MRNTLTITLFTVCAVTLSAQEWEPCARMLTPRMDAASAVVGDTLYVMGGRQRSAGGGSGDQGFEDVVEAYLPLEDRWIGGLPDMPAPRADMAHAIIGQRIYLFGGTASDNTVSNAVWSWRPGEGAWQVHGDSLPVSLRGAAATAVEGASALVMGGLDAAGNFLDTVYRFTPGTGFAAEPSLAQARSGPAAGTAAGQAVITGGYFHGPLPSTEVLSDRTWVEGPALPSSRGSALPCQDGSSLFVLGGEGTEGPLDDVLFLETTYGGWAALASMGTARARFAGGAAGDYLVAAGGTGPVGYEATGTCERALVGTLSSRDCDPVRPEDIELRVWPNPFSTHAEIMANLREDLPWSISIHTVDGKLVCSWQGRSRVASVQFPGEAGLASGFYLITIDGNGREASLPLMRVR